MTYPSVLRRYLATFIDSCFILIAFFGLSYALTRQDPTTDFVRVALILLLLFGYEPICTSRFCTLGQKLTGVRVLHITSRRKISFPAAYLRIVVKIMLGFISLLAIAFSKDRRAVLDLAANSIVIYRT